MKELLEDCDADRLFTAGSADALAESLARWIETPESERILERERSREAVARRRTWGGQVARIVPVYQALVGEQFPKSFLGKEK